MCCTTKVDTKLLCMGYFKERLINSLQRWHCFAKENDSRIPHGVISATKCLIEMLVENACRELIVV